MSGFMRKNLYLCFSKIKCLPPPHDLEDCRSPSSTPTSVLLRSTSSAATPTASNSDGPSSSPPSSSSSSFDDPDFLSSLPDLSTVYASRRFFFSSPGLSNSIVESCLEDAGGPPPALHTAGGVAVRKYSPDPREDFRRSMQDMVEAKEARDVKEDWEYLHELLLCYLRLNPKHTHRFIIGAFTDLIISLMSQSRLDKDDVNLDIIDVGMNVNVKGRQGRTWG
ncbi:hypothetical protein MLD38_027329 [Melastoma candidum]|uniref:Uncharacterized protein n=1 Tax=Melastoma candidum TaxID=119954 RepID=A0ACB9P2G3_9MYRT|nr:hypothetical protein MLD38_027329 [Melastoma candidum]